jgi:hypothetical protein
MTAKENPGGRPGSLRENNELSCNYTAPAPTKQSKFDDDDCGFPSVNNAILRQLIELDKADPLGYAHRLRLESENMGYSNTFLLDRIVQRMRKETPKHDVRRFQVVRAGDLKCKAIDWLVFGLIPSNAIGLIFGESETLKSFLADDLLLCISTGTPFHGRKVKQGPTLLIVGEGQSYLAQRFLAWSINRGRDYQKSDFFVSTVPAAFLEPESVAQVAAVIDEIKPVLIMVDTLARNFGGGDENSTSDMSKFIDAVDSIRRPYNSTLIPIHHTGHGDKDRSRGAYCLKAALDFEYRVKRPEENLVIVECTKMKDGERPESLAFEPQKINMVGEAGERISSLALELTEMPEKQAGKSKMPLANRIALESLTGLLVGRDSVHIEEWRAECYSAGIADTPDAKRQSFGRARKALLSDGLIETRDDRYWLRDMRDIA